jgi:phage baseplate assembly protein gpV
LIEEAHVYRSGGNRGKRHSNGIRRSVPIAVLLVAGVLACGVLAPVALATPPCTDTWVGGSGGSWETESNWSTGVVPGASDTACIGSGATVSVSSRRDETGTLQSEGTLVIGEGGTLTLADEANDSHATTLVLGRLGQLSGAGTLEISGTLTWTGGEMIGTGSTVLQSGATGTIETSGGASLSQRTLVNAGTLSLDSGPMYLNASAEIDNSGTFEANSDLPGSEWVFGGINGDGTTWFHNTGTLKKSAGTQFTQIQAQFDNQGTVESNTGQLVFDGGSYSGSEASGAWDAAEGSSIAFNAGAFHFGAGVTMSGLIFFAGSDIQAPDIQAPGATILLWAGGSSLDLTDAETTSHVAGLTIQSGTSLTGDGTLEVSSAFKWTGGEMTGTGSTVVGSGATGSIESSGGVTITRRTLANAGTLSLDSGPLYTFGSAEIDNSGTFEANSDLPGSEWVFGGINGDGTTWFHNTGTLKKSAGTQFTQIQTQFDNQGTVESNTGQLIFDGGSHSGSEASGAWDASEGSSIAFSGGTFHLGAGVAMSGLIFLAGGNIETPDIQAPEATLLLWSSGSTLDVTDAETTSHAAALTIQHDTTLAGAGTLEVSGALTWTGGEMTGSGTTIIGSGERPVSVYPTYIWQRKLVNNGVFTIADETGLVGGEGAVLENLGTLSMNGRLSVERSGTTPAIVNDGTMERIEGTDLAKVAWSIDNEGTVSASSGTLEFAGGGSGGKSTPGSWLAGTAAEILFKEGVYELGEEVPLEGTITASIASLAFGGPEAIVTIGHVLGTPDIRVFGGTMTIESAFDMKQLNIDTGTLTIDGDAHVSEGFTWDAGEMTGPGTTTLESGVNGTIDGVSHKLNGRGLTNEGALAWTAGPIDGDGHAVLTNTGELSMTSTLFSDTALVAEASGPEFINEGVLENDGSSVQIDWETHNSGTLPGSDPPMCLVCWITDPEAKPPTGVCGLGQSDGITWLPLPGTTYPPSYESDAAYWKCVE